MMTDDIRLAYRANRDLANLLDALAAYRDMEDVPHEREIAKMNVRTAAYVLQSQIEAILTAVDPRGQFEASIRETPELFEEATGPMPPQGPPCNCFYCRYAAAFARTSLKAANSVYNATGPAREDRGKIAVGMRN